MPDAASSALRLGQVLLDPGALPERAEEHRRDRRPRARAAPEPGEPARARCSRARTGSRSGSACSTWSSETCRVRVREQEPDVRAGDVPEPAGCCCPNSGFAWSGERSSEISFVPRWTLRSCAGAEHVADHDVRELGLPRTPVASGSPSARPARSSLNDLRMYGPLPADVLFRNGSALSVLSASGRVRAAVRLHDLGVDDAERRVGDDHRDRRVRRLRLQDDRVVALGRDRGDAREQEGRVALQVDQPAEREDDVLRTSAACRRRSARPCAA